MSDERDADVGRVLASFGAPPFSYVSFSSPFETEDTPDLTAPSPDLGAVLAPGDMGEPEPEPELEGEPEASAPPRSPLFDLLAQTTINDSLPVTAALDGPLAPTCEADIGPDGAAAPEPVVAMAPPELLPAAGTSAAEPEPEPPIGGALSVGQWSAWPAPRPAPWRPRQGPQVHAVPNAAVPPEATDAPPALSLAAHLSRAAEPAAADTPQPPLPEPESDAVAELGEAPEAPRALAEMFRVLSVPREPAREHGGDAPRVPPGDNAPSLFRRL